MSDKQLFTLLGIAGVAIYVYHRLVNPHCRWCGTALQALVISQGLACPACGRGR